LDLAKEIQKDARDSVELSHLLDATDPDNEISGDAIDILITWCVNTVDRKDRLAVSYTVDA